MRSSLTILGIVIGVAAVITMVTLGRGATAQVTSNIAKLGTNLLHVRPGQGHRGPGGTRSTGDMFEVDDAEAIARDISGLAAVAPAASQATQAIYGNDNWSTSVIGTGRLKMDVSSPTVSYMPARQCASWVPPCVKNCLAARIL